MSTYIEKNLLSNDGQAFQAGDRVFLDLKQRGPEMIVERYPFPPRPLVSCMWFDDITQSEQHRVFPEDVLAKVEQEAA